MKIKTKKSFSKIPSHDLTLKSISWPKNEDNNLTIQCENINNKFVEFIFEWVTNLKIDLDLKEVAQAMTWSIEAEINMIGIWGIVFNFPGIGFISLECNEIEYREL